MSDCQNCTELRARVAELEQRNQTQLDTLIQVTDKLARAEVRIKTQREWMDKHALDYLTESQRAERAEAALSTAMDECAKAQAERDALRQDAERYRWLRANKLIAPYTRDELDPASWDAAIDAARKP